MITPNTITIRHITINVADFFIGLAADGVFPAVYAIIIYIPQIVIMLAIVSLFENSGFTLGFGCTTLAVSAIDKNMPPKELRRNIRFMTFLPCGTKFPVLLYLGSVLLGWTVFGVIFMYVFSVAVGLLLGGRAVVKMPRFQKCGAKKYLKLILQNTWDFLRRVIVGIVIAAAVLYVLQYFNLLLPITRVLEPLFVPIGLDAAPLIACLVFGLVSKEMIIGSVLSFGVVNLGLTAAQAVSFLFFVLLYTPCIPALNAIRAKLGVKYMLRAAFFNFAVAYAVSFVAYTALVMIQ